MSNFESNFSRNKLTISRLCLKIQVASFPPERAAEKLDFDEDSSPLRRQMLLMNGVNNWVR